MHRAFSGGYGGFLCQAQMKKFHLTSNESACIHEQVSNADCVWTLYKMGNSWMIKKYYGK